MNGEEVSFNVDKALQRPDDFHVNTMVDIFDEAAQILMKLAYSGANLMVGFMKNYGDEDENDYDEVIGAMIGAGLHPRNLVKLDIDLKKWDT